MGDIRMKPRVPARQSLLAIALGLSACSGQSQVPSTAVDSSLGARHISEIAATGSVSAVSTASVAQARAIDASLHSSLFRAAQIFDSRNGNIQTTSRQFPDTGTPNFANARNLSLTRAQVDSSIDPAITGADREFVLNAMVEMPPGARHNFALTDGVHDYANTLAGLAALRQQHCTPIDASRCVDAAGSILYALPPDHDAGSIAAGESSSAGPFAILGGTGFFYKFTESYSGTAFSAAHGYFSTPQCSELSDPKNGIVTGQHGSHPDVRYYLAGGLSADRTEAIDTGIQINSGTLTISPYFLSNYLKKNIIVAGSPPLKVPCDPGSPNVQPQHYWLILAGVYSDPSGSMKATWETTIQEYNPDGTPTIVNGKPVISTIGPVALRGTWHVMCTACTVKREITVAQDDSSGLHGITDTNDFTGFDMYRRVLPGVDPEDDTRQPFGQLVNWRYGTFAGGVANFPTAQYLGQTLSYSPHGKTDDPNGSGQLSNWEILTNPTPPNAGTSGVGIFAATCQNLSHVRILCETSENGNTYRGN